VLKKYTLNKKLFEESSRNVYSEYLEDSTGKEELYLRKIKHQQSLTHSVTTKETLCSSHNSYFVLLGSVHISAVLCHVLVSTCSSILNVYVASCFFIKM
jgi:K+-sensing histidine kinase KdpD